MANYIFIDKSLFFPKQGILAIGDLHLGYEHMMKQSGLNLPPTQIKDIISNLKDIFAQVKKKGHQIKKVVFLGDIKHYFGYEHEEKKSFNDVLAFLKTYFDEKDIILIRGNHDAVQYSQGKMRNYYITEGIAFLHGHSDFPEVYGKEVKTIVIGHLHPSVMISDKAGVKKEKFKCFLVGKMKGKELIVLPSFFEIVEGKIINDYKESYHNFISIVPKSALLSSEVFVIGKDKTYNFGKVIDVD